MAFIVTDIEKSAKFYCDILGLKKAFEMRNPAGVLAGIYLHAGGRTFIELFKGEVVPAHKNQSYKHMCIETEDIKEMTVSIRSKGIEVTEIKMGLDNSYQAWLADPDGNRIELHQYTPTSLQSPWVK